MSWNADDPGDSLYRTARSLLNRGRYNEAASAFADLAKRYPSSSYTPDSYYWQAFSLYKTGEVSKLKQARSVLDYQKQHYPDASTHGDADALYAQVQGALARQGDGPAGEWVQKHASQVDSGRTTAGGGCASGDDDDDPRIAALNALLQMDADRAVPVLKKVLERRDACSVSLRRKAVFIISQQHTAETEDILLGAARSDPDEEVREQAVFWLSQVGSAKAASALDSILLNSSNTDLQKKAVFALSQISSPDAMRMLRDYAEKAGAPVEARADAIFWLSQQGHGENADYLKTLYGRLNDDDLKDKAIFSIAQIGGADNLNWLMELAANQQEPTEMRKKALFWAGQSNDVSLERLTGLYDRMKDRDMKEQMIFVYSQRHEGQALDKLIDIAKHDTDPELRKKAIFWIGQSHDPKAAQAAPAGGHQPNDSGHCGLGSGAPHRERRPRTRGIGRRVSAAPDGAKVRMAVPASPPRRVRERQQQHFRSTARTGTAGNHNTYSRDDRDVDVTTCPLRGKGPSGIVPFAWPAVKVTRVRAYVGGDWKQPEPGTTDLGVVRGQGSGRVSPRSGADRHQTATSARKPSSPSTLADSVTVWPDLFKIARSEDVPRATRKSAVFWIGQAAGDAATKGLDSLAQGSDVDREVRESAVFALSQQRNDVGVPALITIARTNKDPDIREEGDLLARAVR